MLKLSHETFKDANLLVYRQALNVTEENVKGNYGARLAPPTPKAQRKRGTEKVPHYRKNRRALKMAKEIYGYYRYYRKCGWASDLALKKAKAEWTIWQNLKKVLGA